MLWKESSVTALAHSRSSCLTGVSQPKLEERRLADGVSDRLPYIAVYINFIRLFDVSAYGTN